MDQPEKDAVGFDLQIVYLSYWIEIIKKSMSEIAQALLSELIRVTWSYIQHCRWAEECSMNSLLNNPPNICKNEWPGKYQSTYYWFSNCPLCSQYHNKSLRIKNLTSKKGLSPIKESTLGSTGESREGIMQAQGYKGSDPSRWNHPSLPHLCCPHQWRPHQHRLWTSSQSWVTQTRNHRNWHPMEESCDTIFSKPVTNCCLPHWRGDSGQSSTKNKRWPSVLGSDKGKKSDKILCLTPLAIQVSPAFQKFTLRPFTFMKEL